MNIFSRLIPKRTLYRTPYDEINETLQRVIAGKSIGKPYDFFVSYKSEDVHIVRQIAEQMIANGLKVWFAEYAILLTGRGEPDLQQAIDVGVQHTQIGICFTNDRYINSQYCRYELEQLLNENNCGPRKVIEIRLPTEPLPHKRYPQLDESSSTEHRDINNTLHFIQQVSGLPVRPMESMDSSPYTQSIFHYTEGSYSLDLTGWSIKHQQNPAPDKDGDVRGPTFRCWCGKDQLWGHLLIGKQDEHISRKISKNDREYYEDAIEFARLYYGKIWRRNSVGVHLLFLHDFSHNAITTFMGGIWSRLYSIVFSNPNGYQDIEFAFFFFFNGSFQDFCRHAHLMDKVVCSLKEI